MGRGRGGRGVRGQPRQRSGHYTVTSPGNSRKVITVGSLTDERQRHELQRRLRVVVLLARADAVRHVLKPDLVAPGNKIVAPFSPDSTPRPRCCRPPRPLRVRSGTAAAWRYLQLSGHQHGRGRGERRGRPHAARRDPYPHPGHREGPAHEVRPQDVGGDPTATGAGVLDVEAAMNATGVMTRPALSPLMKLSSNGQIAYVQDTAAALGRLASGRPATSGRTATCGPTRRVSASPATSGRTRTSGPTRPLGRRVPLDERLPVDGRGGAGVDRRRGPGRARGGGVSARSARPATPPVGLLSSDRIMLPAPTVAPPRVELTPFSRRSPRRRSRCSSAARPRRIAWGQKWLERFGFEVLTAGALEEAASLLGSGPPRS